MSPAKTAEPIEMAFASPYLSRYCQPLSVHSGQSQLRSAEVQQLFVPRIRTTVMGSRGFYYAASASWNDLPPLLRDPNLTLTDFRLMMKTVLFSDDLLRCCARLRDRLL